MILLPIDIGPLLKYVFKAVGSLLGSFKYPLIEAFLDSDDDNDDSRQVPRFS